MLEMNPLACKTKITVVGSDVDTTYYMDVLPWKMDNNTVAIVEDTEHLGQTVIGCRQEEKNVDQRLIKGRGIIFKLLGPAFPFKCLLSPVFNLYLFRTFVCSILRSGLTTFVLREKILGPLTVFERKTLRSILKLSKTSANCAQYL